MKYQRNRTNGLICYGNIIVCYGNINTRITSETKVLK